VSSPIEKHPVENQLYTCDDYYSWDDDRRWELIDGSAYLMSPSPTWKHQGILVGLTKQFAVFLEGKPCNVFVTPFDVRLNADTKDDTVVQPDLLIVCDKSKLDAKGCNGAPDMVVEILSPSTLRRDRLIKLNLYQKAGVREYWIVDPESLTVSVHILENGKYTVTAYGDEDTAPVSVLEGCEINLTEVFAL